MSHGRQVRLPSRLDTQLSDCTRETKTPIPVRYRCKVGGEWKPIQAFSGNQQRLIQRQVNGSGKVDAANSGMTCLEHSAAFRGELRCDLCQLIKPYDDFSKSQRKNDEPVSACDPRNSDRHGTKPGRCANDARRGLKPKSTMSSHGHSRPVTFRQKR